MEVSPYTAPFQGRTFENGLQVGGAAPQQQQKVYEDGKEIYVPQSRTTERKPVPMPISVELPGYSRVPVEMQGNPRVHGELGEETRYQGELHSESRYHGELHSEPKVHGELPGNPERR